MPITLSWSNYNLPEQFSHTEIYRSTDKSSLYDAENLLTTINDKAQASYVDNSAVREVKYYYGVSVSSEVGLVRTPPILATFTAFEGFGGSKLISGNQEFGMIQPSSFRDIHDIASMIASEVAVSAGFSSTPYAYNAVNTADSGLPFLHKLWYNGEIIYVPNSYDFYTVNSSASVTFSRLKAFMASNNRTFELNGQMYEVVLMDKKLFLDVIVAGMRDQRVVPNRCIPRTVASSVLVSGYSVGAVVLPKEEDNVIYASCNTDADVFYTLDTTYTNSIPTAFVGWYVRPLKT